MEHDVVRKPLTLFGIMLQATDRVGSALYNAMQHDIRTALGRRIECRITDHFGCPRRMPLQRARSMPS
ncbi:hypothetical protein CUJ84_Chr000438 [Rhizobium leguminosarum]|uniref:Uncharacterized protein n=1 Tax=Rhizobium leguminosarum TaxID=384 RepID=A0A2K9YXX8_RHILE|nr:hypothetical protein CUJ84_Chr000438 [Rhizobium leguminosarum]